MFDLAQLRQSAQLVHRHMAPTPQLAWPLLAQRLGNTPEADGDGQKYRGRGLIQVTGRRNYLICSQALFGDERLLLQPELLEQPQWAAESAAWFWHSNGLNELADNDQFTTITRRINGGLNGLEERLRLWTRAKAVLCVS